MSGHASSSGHQLHVETLGQGGTTSAWHGPNREAGGWTLTEKSGHQGGLPFELSPIPRIDVFRSIIEQIAARVEHMEPGDRVGSERQLAEQLHVSRVSIREALRALESMGKVEIRRNSGTFVARRQGSQQTHLAMPEEVTPEFIVQIGEAREAVECAVLRSIHENPHCDLGEVRSTLEAAGEELRKAGDKPGSLDLRFEVALSRQCPNPVLVELQHSLHELWIEAWVRLGGAVADAPRLHAEHVEILSALEAGDVSTAVELTAAHVNPVGWTHSASIWPASPES